MNHVDLKTEGREALAALAVGAGALGASAALGAGSLVAPLSFPLTLAAVGGVMIPALYIALALAGAAPAFAELARGALSSFGALGVVLLGLVPSVLFLEASVVDPATARAVVLAALALGALIGLRVFFDRVVRASGAAARAALVFAIWALVTVGIGAHVFGVRVMG